jgi:hypothetical protein
MGEPTLPITGGCLCGAVCYESSEPPIKGIICHCRMCQKSTGSAFMVAVGFPRTTLQFTKGEPKLYRSSPIKDKGFCSNCGSLLFDQYLARTGGSNPDIIFVQLGTLDHPETVSITSHYGVESQLPWVHFDDGLPRGRCDEDPEMAAAFAAAEAGGE